MAALTKMAIVKAFEELARVKNVDRITVKEITDKCQISRNTFYYHFKDIYDVLEEMLNQRVEQMIETLELNMQSGNSVQDTRRAGMRYILDNRELFFNLYQSAGVQEVKMYLDKSSSVLRHYLIDRLSEGMNVSERDKDLIISFYQYAHAGMMAEWLEKGMKDDLEERMNRMDVLFEGDIVMALERSARNPE
ncbi:TetR/AcrR family transcriptional regulator C-terminal domain-containing protein [Enterocloster citroniae]|uniref:TetR/AcrR family transcriptional regulator C-terminal domain-containing protein n=1 Tax=Enterocloster citroniae TaxID=358743 RepID=UPI00349F0126